MDETSEFKAVVVGSTRREWGMMLARETARMHVEMAAELAAGRIQEVQDIPQLEGEMRDDFDDVMDGFVVAVERR